MSMNDYSMYEGKPRDVDYQSLQPDPTKIETDWPGHAAVLPVAARGDYEKLRSAYDYALQAAGVHPMKPQKHFPGLDGYEKQLLQTLAAKTQKFKGLDCMTIAPENLDRTREQIVCDAMDSARREGVLREIQTVDPTGRKISEFVGDKAWFRSMKGRPQATGIVIDGVPRRF